MRNKTGNPRISLTAKISLSSILLKLNSFSLKLGVIDSNVSGLRLLTALSLLS